MSNLTQTNNTLSVDDQARFELEARQRYDTWLHTGGHGYTVYQFLTRDQSENIPGWLHALINHYIAIRYGFNVPITPANPVDVDVIQWNLHANLRLLVSRGVILSTIHDFYRYPLDLQNLWRRATIYMPMYGDIPELYREIIDDRQHNPRDPESRRREEVRNGLLEQQRRRSSGVQGDRNQMTYEQRRREELRDQLGRPSDLEERRRQDRDRARARSMNVNDPSRRSASPERNDEPRNYRQRSPFAPYGLPPQYVPDTPVDPAEQEVTVKAEEQEAPIKEEETELPIRLSIGSARGDSGSGVPSQDGQPTSHSMAGGMRSGNLSTRRPPHEMLLFDDEERNRVGRPAFQAPRVSDEEDFLGIMGQRERVGIDDVDIEQYTNPLANPDMNPPQPPVQPPAPVPAPAPAPTPAPAPAPAPLPTGLSAWVPPPIPPTGPFQNQGRYHVGPGGIRLTLASRGNFQPTVDISSTPLEVEYFKSIWQVGNHTPDIMPDHVYVCPLCGGKVRAKRQMRRHFRTMHPGVKWIEDQELPRRVRFIAGRPVLVDDQGNPLP